jgi:YgiT-type zinc finger domain-containing protein
MQGCVCLSKGEKGMKCVICGVGETESGTATITLEKDTTIIVFKQVPADVCQTCGESYTDEDVTDRLLSIVTEEAKRGPMEAFMQYVV